MKNLTVQNFKENRSALGVADRIYSLHNLNRYSGKSVPLIRIQMMGLFWKQITRRIQKLIPLQLQYILFLYIMTWTQLDSIKLAKSKCHISIIYLEQKSVILCVV